ncbi:hypothetical protein ACOSQ4_001000 [Xanthoceras sorbifolium]
MKWLKRVVGPDEFFTVNFHPDGMSLLASPQDDESIIALLRINRESFSLFLVDSDHSWSCSVSEKKVLQIERNEYVIEFEDVEKEDDSPYVVLFILKHLRSLNDSIERSNNVCIYPTYLGGPPACLSCTFDSIGEISYFFPPSS